MENRNEKVEIIQINISGEDKPGLTSSLTDILARYDATILDIGQANIHQTLSMGILFKTDSQRAGDIMKDLLFKAYELAFRCVSSRLPPNSTKTGWECRGKTVTSSRCSAVS